jgi:hypothetical protein
MSLHPKTQLERLSFDSFRAGQRVRRKTTEELGTIVEADGDIKVKWDGGRTSYFRRGQKVDVRLKEDDTRH